ncbi:hypothetical protein J2Z49_000909 [Desulfofundulus luciae]|uniref:Uncharacterized protein n=1 Tax=Desulfofundulus luciae TaxID=74702 RepID=A0ABU0B0K3_9FIRM|nr:hypothetical protein [Desulfofundulus luciae]
MTVSPFKKQMSLIVKKEPGGRLAGHRCERDDCRFRFSNGIKKGVLL